jgi:hypothetical protein
MEVFYDPIGTGGIPLCREFPRVSAIPVGREWPVGRLADPSNKVDDVEWHFNQQQPTAKSSHLHAISL